MQAELLFNAQASLGEGPAWDEKTQTLYWVDILNKRIHTWKNNRDDFFQLDDFVGCVAPRRDGGFVAALRASVQTFSGSGKRETLLATFSDEPKSNRLNDGKCDPAGRFLVGSMDMQMKQASGNLYSLISNSPPRKLLGDIRISNGLAWSTDYKIFYYIDTPTRQVRAFDYDLDSGDIANPRIVIALPESMGWPDGMTSDMQGRLWIALWGGSGVGCWNPLTGRLEARVDVPALQTSSCVFGGAERNILYVTSARVDMDAAALALSPLSGGVFAVETKTQGMPTFEFAG